MQTTMLIENKKGWLNEKMVHLYNDGDKLINCMQ